MMLAVPLCLLLLWFGYIVAINVLEARSPKPVA
jgi:hypothetical protein